MIEYIKRTYHRCNLAFNKISFTPIFVTGKGKHWSQVAKVHESKRLTLPSPLVESGQLDHLFFTSSIRVLQSGSQYESLSSETTDSIFAQLCITYFVLIVCACANFILYSQEIKLLETKNKGKIISYKPNCCCRNHVVIIFLATKIGHYWCIIL